MIRRRNPLKLTAAFPRLLALASALLLSSLLAFGCKSHSHTSDFRLQKIDEMLNSQLPQGTPKPRVEYFLNSRGYQLEDSPDKAALVAVVRHIDTETLIPATARVTFHFDSNEKLLSYELQPAADAPLRP
jgi:hypothetical protein